MTAQEFSIEFDILYNNLASNTAPPVNEYEKSVFLTKAQSDIVLELYSGRNNFGLAFETSQEARQYLNTLITVSEIDLENPNLVNEFHEYQVYREWESAALVSIKEEIVTSQNRYAVVPISLDSIDSVLKNPHKGPKAGRRAISVGSTDGNLDLYIASSEDEPLVYKHWYLKYPAPIILPDINEDGLTIQGEECTSYADEGSAGELPISLHRTILDRAVIYAKQAYIGGQAQE